jgi:hypothetical protein
MNDMWDAVDWTQLKGRPGVKAGYLDGNISRWPAEAWTELAGVPLVHITTLASPFGEAFDMEAGNASPDTVFAVIAGRTARGLWSWAYCAMDGWADVASAAKRKGVVFLDRSEWPQSGCYLWPSDPSGNLKAGRWRLPVDPVAVQDGYDGPVDHSTLYVNLEAPQSPQPAPGPVPEPLPRPVNEDTMQLANINGTLTVVGEAADNGDLLIFERTLDGKWTVGDITEGVKNANPSDAREYRIH